jgi:hypothetical protein
VRQLGFFFIFTAWARNSGFCQSPIEVLVKRFLLGEAVVTTGSDWHRTWIALRAA